VDLLRFVVALRARLEQIINMKHELVLLAGKIEWQRIDSEIAPLYSEKVGRGLRPGSSSGYCCSSTSTDCPTRVSASAGCMTHISSTSPERSFSSTSFRTNDGKLR
jgi:hypothetical protein